MSKHRPEVTVVIPTYNQAHFLHKALQSVLAQTFTNWEAIVINNFSEDNTIDVVNSFKDSRIHLINYSNKGIIAASRNEGIRLAGAEFIAFLDSDDVWYPHKLSRCLEKLTPEVDLVCHGLCFTKEGKLWRNIKPGSAKNASYHKLLYKGNCLTPSAVVIRKQSLMRVGGFDEDKNIVTAEDYDLWLKLAKKGVHFHFINDMLGEYRLHGDNASKAVLRHMQAGLAVVDKHYDDMRGTVICARFKIRRRRALFFYSAARQFQQNRKITEAIRYYWKSVVIFPFILRVYVAVVQSIFDIIYYSHKQKS